MPSLSSMAPLVSAYVRDTCLSHIPGWLDHVSTTVEPLAQGEYNLNYLLRQGHNTWVFRVNIGTQIARTDQILYEYRALELLQDTGVTPKPYWVDDSKSLIPHGILIMEYLPGGSLDYRRDLSTAARLFACIHTHPVPEANHLIREDRPLSMTFEECSRLLPMYLESDLADNSIRAYLREVLDWADQARHREAFFLSDPWPCIINTEVNSGNFIANREQGSLHLVDWEKPLWGDPSQDLSHFCVPTTTLWKTDYRMTESDKQTFLTAYRQAVPDQHLRDTITERVRLRDPFNCLRGISWSAWAWVAYQTGDHAVRNQDTFHKLNDYLDLGFIQSLFSAYIS